LYNYLTGQKTGFFLWLRQYTLARLTDILLLSHWVARMFKAIDQALFGDLQLLNKIN